jgi:hypothetical protein
MRRLPFSAGSILGFVLFAGLVVPEFAQEAQMPRTPSTEHASLSAYANAVISLKDPKTGMMFYVESSGRRLVGFNRDGRVMWNVDVLDAAKIKAGPGQQVIRHLRLEGDHLWVTFGKSDTAKVQIETGKVQYIGSD